MPNRYVYALSGGEPDMSRWLEIHSQGSDQCTVHLQELCLPGRPCGFTLVTCPLKFLHAAVQDGALQVSTREGYLLVRRDGDLATVEFRGRDDKGPIKASLRAVDLEQRIQQLCEEMPQGDCAEAP